MPVQSPTGKTIVQDLTLGCTGTWAVNAGINQATQQELLHYIYPTGRGGSEELSRSRLYTLIASPLFDRKLFTIIRSLDTTLLQKVNTDLLHFRSKIPTMITVELQANITNPAWDKINLDTKLLKGRLDQAEHVVKTTIQDKRYAAKPQATAENSKQQAALEIQRKAEAERAKQQAALAAQQQHQAEIARQQAILEAQQRRQAEIEAAAAQTNPWSRPSDNSGDNSNNCVLFLEEDQNSWPLDRLSLRNKWPSFSDSEDEEEEYYTGSYDLSVDGDPADSTSAKPHIDPLPSQYIRFSIHTKSHPAIAANLNENAPALVAASNSSRCSTT